MKPEGKSEISLPVDLPKGEWAAPKFDECKFLVDGPGRVVNIVLKK